MPQLANEGAPKVVVRATSQGIGANTRIRVKYLADSADSKHLSVAGEGGGAQKKGRALYGAAPIPIGESNPWPTLVPLPPCHYF